MNQPRPGNTPESLADIARQQALNPPHYFEDSHKEQLIRLALSLAEEVCVLRDQLDTSLLLSAQGRPCSPEAIEAFEPDESLVEQRLARHRGYFEQIMQQLLPEQGKHQASQEKQLNA